MHDLILREHGVGVDRSDAGDRGTGQILVERLLLAIGDRLLEKVVIPGELLLEQRLNSHGVLPIRSEWAVPELRILPVPR
jgi:hypothetical protein